MATKKNDKNKFKKCSCKDPQGLEIFSIRHCLVDLYQNCSSYSPWVKIGPTLGVIDFHDVHIVKK
jgi:hypothetical protein